MRSLLRKPPTPLRAIIAVFALFVLVFVPVVIARVAEAASASEAAKSDHIVSIYDRGIEKVILTHAGTVGDAIADAGISLDPKDAVDPTVDAPISSVDFKVNIYRARPVVVVDGAIRQKIMTPYQTSEQIAKDAGITLYDEDKTTVSLSDDIVSAGAGLTMTIQRATPITFIQYGTTITVRTQANTVAGMLAEKGVVLAENDTLSISGTTPIQAGMTVELWRNGVQTITQNEDVPFEVQHIQDANQPIGYKAVQTPGVLGKKTVTYQVEMKNGQELSRQEIQSVTTSEPKKQVEVVGAKHSLPPGSHQDWMASAGILPSDYGNVNLIITGESHWNPAAVSLNGYYGLGQTNLSAISSACPDWQFDPICQLRFFSGYANRYGGWGGAAQFWADHHWW